MIDDKRFPLEEIKPNTRENILYDHKDDIGAYCVLRNSRPYDNLGKIACHTHIRTIVPEELTNFIGVYDMSVTGAPELWEYITSLEGPFRDLFLFAPDGWSLLTYEGEVFGFRMPDKIFSFKPYPLLYAFLICSRMPQDYSDQVQSFAYLVSKGIDKWKAFIMSVHLTVSAGVLQVKSYSHWGGDHQCLSETSYKVIDVHSWRDGKYNTEDINSSSPTSSLWHMKSKLKINKFLWGSYGVSGKTKFGAPVTTIDDEGLKKLSVDFDKYIELRYGEKNGK